MTIKILTDSVSDIPSQLIQELDITVIPILIRWGEEMYRDGVDMTPSQFYQRLKHSKIPPATSLPAPMTFAQSYDELAEQADGIVAIMVSSNLSGTHEVALQSVGLMKKKCPVEVIDSRLGAMAEGFVALQAARAAKAGATFSEVVRIARDATNRITLIGTLQTLEYLKRGGRIGKAQAFLGAMLNINPIISLKNGVIEPFGRARTRAGAIERLYEFARDSSKICELAVEDADCTGEADKLTARLADFIPRESILRSSATPAIGAHGGPGLLLLSILGDGP